MKLAWRPREEPLSPEALIATGDARLSVIRRLLELDDVALEKMSGVDGEGVIVVIGPDLPWADGVRYLGRDAAARSLLLPTNQRPNIPLDLFERSIGALAAKSGFGAGPWAVSGDPLLVVPLASVRQIDRERLRGRLEAGP
jgi:hypothetical protein